MDEIDVPENCLILSPEELVKLGVKIDTLATAADKSSNTEHVKKIYKEDTKAVDALKQQAKPQQFSIRRTDNPKTYSAKRKFQSKNATNASTLTNKQTANSVLQKLNKGITPPHDSANVNLEVPYSDEPVHADKGLNNYCNSDKIAATSVFNEEQSKANVSSSIYALDPIKKRGRGRPKKSFVSEDVVAPIFDKQEQTKNFVQLKSDKNLMPPHDSASLSGNPDIPHSKPADAEENVNGNADKIAGNNGSKHVNFSEVSSIEGAASIINEQGPSLDPIKKRGRGRPKRSLTNSVLDKQEPLKTSDSNSTPDSVEELEPERPKIVDKQELVETSDSTTTQASDLVKKHGPERPKTVLTTSTLDEQAPVETSDFKSTQAPDSVKKRGPGRPKSFVTTSILHEQEPVETSDFSSTQASDSVKKRGPGRPKSFFTTSIFDEQEPVETSDFKSTQAPDSVKKRGPGRPKSFVTTSIPNEQEPVETSDFRSTLASDSVKKRGPGRPKSFFTTSIFDDREPSVETSDFNSTQAPDSVKKRGRGRPKSVFSTSIFDEQEPVETSDFNSTQAPDSEKKRGRGRPKKVLTTSILEEQEPVETCDSNRTQASDPVKKRGPGRPKSFLTTPIPEKLEPLESCDFSSTQNSDSVKKRGPGRPKCSVTTSTLQEQVPGETSDSYSTQNPDSAKKRGPGRPKKSPCTDPDNVPLISQRDEEPNPDIFTAQEINHIRPKLSGETAEPLSQSLKKRKRGRPQRISDLNSNDDFSFQLTSKSFNKRRRLFDSSDSDAEESVPLNIISNELINNIHTLSELDNPTEKRRRGRPRKSATEAATKIVPEPDANVVIGTSLKGRKRKEVNYSLDLEEDIRKPKRTSKTRQYCYKKDSIKYDENIIDNSPTMQDEPKNVIVNNEDNVEDNAVKVIEEQEISIKERRDSKNEGSHKYNWTGDTVTALNHIFNSLQGKDVKDISHDSQSGLIKRKRGKASHNNDLLLDENGESVCMVCNEVISNREWIEHKRKMHYNLTWRKGDLPVDISDPTMIQKAFEELRREEGHFKCHKCKKKICKTKKFMKHLELCNGVVSASGSVTCAVCKTEIEKSEWHYHKYREHNNLAWREGDPPLNLEDQDLVLRILQQLYKNKKPLHCEICKEQKKSVLGYLSHKSVCRASLEEVENAKVACKVCGKKVLPVSLTYHVKTHNKPKFDTSEESGYFDVDLDTSGPRKAAKQALQIIRSIKGEVVETSKYYADQCDFDDDFVISELKKRAAECPNLPCLFNDCDFQATSIDAMIQHLKSCDKKPEEQYFICKLCLTWCKEEIEIKKHIKRAHNRVPAGDKDVEFGNESEEFNSEDDKFIEEVEMEKKRLRQKGKSTVMNNQKAKPIFLVHPIREQYMLLVYPQAYPWMYNFCEKHYTNLNLFESFRNNKSWQVVGCDILNDYLPRRHESCDITVKALTVEDELNNIGESNFTKLGLFEVRNFHKGEATIYCGGPITALTWLPTPYNKENQNQVLAVAVLNEFEKEYSVGETYNEPYVIQFWSVGDLNWSQVKDCDVKPVLLFGLALTTGPVWHLEWCPSGCLDLSEDESRIRLGLLAVATSDSFVYIYCIDDVKDDSDRGLIYRGEPIVKLQLEMENCSVGLPYYANRISWTKAEGHRFVAVGYSTGMIALFDLLSLSPLLQRRDHAGTQIILPYQTFQAHVSCITVLTLGHFGEGKRWCFSAAQDKCLMLWDLSNLTRVTSQRKHGIADGLWLTQWPACLAAEDESSFNDLAGPHSFLKSVRDVMGPEACNLTYSPSGLKSISFSDWLNLILHGGNAGEVLGQFCHRMFFNIDKKQFKKSYVRCILSVAKLTSKCGSNDLLNTYDTATANYGITFVDYNSENLLLIPNSKTNNVKIGIEKYNIEDYPLKAVNKVAVNPNPQACTFFASGYQAGFVRVRAMEFLQDNFNPQTFAGYDFSASI